MWEYLDLLCKDSHIICFISYRAEHESWPAGFPRFYFLIYTTNTYPINYIPHIHMLLHTVCPFLIILTIIAVTRDVAQISTVSFCQYITCWILHHIITYINMIWQVYSVLPSLVILNIFNMSNTNWIMKHWILDQMSQNKLQDPDSCNLHPVKSRCGNIWICCARIAILHISCYLPQIRL